MEFRGFLFACGVDLALVEKYRPWLLDELPPRVFH
jgi:hypothetical protein